MRIKTALPIILSLVTVIVLGSIIAKHEQHLHQSNDLYIKLTPADPRSLIQGDYMALGYDLYWHTGTMGLIEYGNIHQDKYHNKSSVEVWVLTDEQDRLVKSAFTKAEFSPAEQAKLQPLILKNPHNYIASLYPAADSYLFAEGLAECYAQATYAHQKVDKNGKPMLLDLVNDELRPLNCEHK